MAPQRIHFVNELHRVLIPGGSCEIITPHWCSTRAYGDLTHQWPPVSEMWFFYLNRDWRLGDKNTGANAPHNDIKYNPSGYSCDFAATWSYTMHPELVNRNQEFQSEAIKFSKEAAQDIIATLTKKVPNG